MIEVFGFAQDKIAHFAISAALFAIDFAIRKYGLVHTKAGFAAFYAARDVFVLGICKELLDAVTPGNFEIPDMVFNGLGVLFPIYIFYSVTRLRNIPAMRHNRSKVLFKALTVQQNTRTELSAIVLQLLKKTTPKHRAEIYLQRQLKEIQKYHTTRYHKRRIRIFVQCLVSGVIACFEMLWEIITIPIWSATKVIHYFLARM
jgi:hypothetical protein